MAARKLATGLHTVIPAAELRAALAIVERAVERRNVIPILGNVLLRAEADHLSLTATDIGMEARAEVCYPSEQPGAVTVSAEKLKRIVGTLDGADVEMKANGSEGCQIKAGGSRFTLPTLPAADYPERPAIEGAKQFELPAGVLRRLLSRTAFAMSTEETRYYMNAVHLVATGSALRAEATDTHRLARAETDLPEGADGLDLLLPARAVHTLLAMLKGREDAVSITAGNRVIVGVGDATLDTRLIEGTFPETDRVIPRSNERRLTASAEAFSAALTAAATVNNYVQLAVAEDGSIEATAFNDNAEAAVSIDGASCPGGELNVGFNAKYLIEMADGLEGEQITLELQGAGTPAVVRDSGDARWLGVVMPLRF